MRQASVLFPFAEGGERIYSLHGEEKKERGSGKDGRGERQSGMEEGRAVMGEVEGLRNSRGGVERWGNCVFGCKAG